MAETTPDVWRRFTLTTAAVSGAVLLVGLFLTYSGEYHVASHAGLADPWLTIDGREIRPAHFFPLTLGIPVLVGYAGTIALAGRRSIVWARFVLIACAAATVAAQMADGASWILRDDGTPDPVFAALVRGWMGAFPIITAHLFVKIVQALGYLQPPVPESRTSWIARVWRWVRKTQREVASVEQAAASASTGSGPAAELGESVPPDPRGAEPTALPSVTETDPAEGERPTASVVEFRRPAPVPARQSRPASVHRPVPRTAGRPRRKYDPDAIAAIVADKGVSERQARNILAARMTEQEG